MIGVEHEAPDANGDSTAVEHVIRQYKTRLDARITRLRGALHQIDHLLTEGFEAAMSGQDPPDGAATKSAPGTWISARRTASGTGTSPSPTRR